MLDNVHCSTSDLTNTIYIGRVNKKGDRWLEKIDRTEEVIASVRDYLVNVCREEGKSKAGFTWTGADGRTYILNLNIFASPSAYEPPYEPTITPVVDGE